MEKYRENEQRKSALKLIMVELKERRAWDRLEETRQMRNQIVTNIRMKSTDPMHKPFQGMPTEET